MAPERALEPAAPGTRHQ